jgi:hypothetical protein
MAPYSKASLAAASRRFPSRRLSCVVPAINQRLPVCACSSVLAPIQAAASPHLLAQRRLLVHVVVALGPGGIWGGALLTQRSYHGHQARTHLAHASSSRCRWCRWCSSSRCRWCSELLQHGDGPVSISLQPATPNHACTRITDTCRHNATRWHAIQQHVLSSLTFQHHPARSRHPADPAAAPSSSPV